jgi:predicted aldo/keto reductase-like oxidoreductase
MEVFKRMVDTFLDRGFNYFDTAYVYANSEECAKEALVKRYPRERFKLATKMPLHMIKAAADQERVFSEQLLRSFYDFLRINLPNPDNSEFIQQIWLSIHCR